MTIAAPPCISLLCRLQGSTRCRGSRPGEGWKSKSRQRGRTWLFLTASVWLEVNRTGEGKKNTQKAFPPLVFQLVECRRNSHLLVGKLRRLFLPRTRATALPVLHIHRTATTGQTTRRVSLLLSTLFLQGEFAKNKRKEQLCRQPCQSQQMNR